MLPNLAHFNFSGDAICHFSPEMLNVAPYARKEMSSKTTPNALPCQRTRESAEGSPVSPSTSEQPCERPCNALLMPWKPAKTRHFKKARQETPANALVMPTDPRNLLEYIERPNSSMHSTAIRESRRRTCGKTRKSQFHDAVNRNTRISAVEFLACPEVFAEGWHCHVSLFTPQKNHPRALTV